MERRAVAWMSFLHLAALAACDSQPPPWAPEGDGVEIGGAPTVELGCERYCNASFSAGCPPAFDSCIETCSTLFRGTCEQKLADYLACIPERLTQTCLVGLDEPCHAAMSELSRCAYCGDGSAGLVGERGCEGSYACGLMTSCDDDGLCRCQIGEAPVGSCWAIVAGIDGCVAGTSCCTAFL